MQRVILLRVLIASPGDIPNERKVVREAIHTWNHRHSGQEGVVLLPIYWEEDAPLEQGAPPQDLINTSLVDHCDICIGVFWSRIGTRTRTQPGGAAEEVDRMLSAAKPVMVLHCLKRLPVRHDKRQHRAVLEYVDSMEKTGVLGTFVTAQELRDAILRSLPHHVSRARKMQAAVSFDGLWLQIKRGQTERPYALVDITRTPGQDDPRVQGCSYRAKGEVGIPWPIGDIDFTVTRANRLFHTFSTRYKAAKAVGTTCYELNPASRSRPSGSGFYCQQVVGDDMLSQRMDFDLIRVDGRVSRHFISKDRPESDRDREEFIARYHVQNLQERILITGGSFSGKSTLIRALERRGCRVLHEAACEVIQEQRKIRGNAGFIAWRTRNPQAFQELIFAQHLANEHLLSQSIRDRTRLFMDRSGVDCIAYLQSAGLPVPERLMDYAHAVRFRHVIVLDTLEPYKPRTASGRTSTFSDSKRIRDAIIGVYTDLGYSPELVRQMDFGSVRRCRERRLERILAIIGGL